MSYLTWQNGMLEGEVSRLKDELAAERKRREDVEDLWHQEQQAHTAAVTRAEEAERQLHTTHRQVAEVARLLDPEVCPDAWGLHAAAQKVLARAGQAERGQNEARQQAMDRAGDLSAACRERDEIREMHSQLAGVCMEHQRVRERAEADNAALLELSGLVRQYQRKDEAALADTFRRLMAERARIAEMVSPDVHAALLERMRALEKVALDVAGCIHADRSIPCGECYGCRADALKVPHE